MVFPASQLGLDLVLDNRQSGFFEPHDVRLDGGRQRQVFEQSASPQRQGLVKGIRRRHRVVTGQQLAAICGELFEPPGIDGLARDPQGVAPAARDEHGVCDRSCRSERLTQARNVDAQRGRRTRRLAVLPEPGSQVIQGHDLIDPEEQHGEQGALLDPPQFERLAVKADDERPEDPEVQVAPTPARRLYHDLSGWSLARTTGEAYPAVPGTDPDVRDRRWRPHAS